MRKRILLLDPDDRDVVDLHFPAIREQLVVDLARAREHAPHALRGELVHLADHVLEAAVGQVLERRHRFLVPEQALRAHHDQRFPVLAEHLPPQHVEHLRRRGRHAHLHVVLRAQLQEALGTRRRVLGTLAFEAVRQQHDQAADPAPLHFAGADELVDDHLRAVHEIAELRFPDHEARRVRRRIAVLEAHDRLLGQHRIDDLETRLLRADVLQRNVRAVVPLFAVLVVQHRVAVRERAATDVLAGQAHAVAFVEQRRVGQRLAHAPVERQLALAHRPAVGDDLVHARMQLEAGGNRRQPLRERAQLLDRHGGRPPDRSSGGSCRVSSRS